MLWPAVAASLVLGFALLGLINVATTAPSLFRLLQSADPGQVIGLRYLATEYPGFAAAIVGAALLTVAFRRIQPAALTALRAKWYAEASAEEKAAAEAVIDHNAAEVTCPACGASKEEFSITR